MICRGQGQSDSTEFKERGLEAAFTINIKIFKSKFGDKFRYWHFDLNCGSGVNQEVGCIGSPIAFVRAADAIGVDNFFAGFCDKNSEFLSCLMSNREIAGRDNCYTFNGDNSGLILAIPEIIKSFGENPKFAVGMVLSDDNGTGVPLDGLERLSRECPRLDFVVNWNSAAFKRNARNSDICLSNAIDQMNKKHWIIREPSGIWQWTLLVGRNMDAGSHRALGFHKLDTTHGRAAFNKCNFKKCDVPAPRQIVLPWGART